MSKHAIQSLAEAAQAKHNEAAESADVRFSLHDIYNQRQSGQLYPKDPQNVNEWARNLQGLQKSQDLLSQTKKTDLESIRSIS